MWSLSSTEYVWKAKLAMQSWERESEASPSCQVHFTGWLIGNALASPGVLLKAMPPWHTSATVRRIAESGCLHSFSSSSFFAAVKLLGGRKKKTLIYLEQKLELFYSGVDAVKWILSFQTPCRNNIPDSFESDEVGEYDLSFCMMFFPPSSFYKILDDNKQTGAFIQ